MSLVFTPPDTIEFAVDGHRSQLAQLVINNTGEQPIAYKIKTTSPRCFTVNPISGLIIPREEASVVITLLPSEEAFNKPHKFEIRAIPCPTSDLSSLDWGASESLKRYKLGATVVDTSLCASERGFASVRTHYSEVKSERLQLLKDERQNLLAKNSLLTRELDQLNIDIEKVQHKLKFSLGFESAMKEGTGEGFSYVHLALTALLGLFLGYFLF